MKPEDLSYLLNLANGSFSDKKRFRRIFPNYIKDGEALLEFLFTVKQQRGFGQTIRKAVLNWIYTKDPKLVKRELCKSYEDFDGLTVLRLFRPKPINNDLSKAFSEIKSYFLSKR